MTKVHMWFHTEVMMDTWWFMMDRIGSSLLKPTRAKVINIGITQEIQHGYQESWGFGKCISGFQTWLFKKNMMLKWIFCWQVHFWVGRCSCSCWMKFWEFSCSLPVMKGFYDSPTSKSLPWLPIVKLLGIKNQLKPTKMGPLLFIHGIKKNIYI